MLSLTNLTEPSAKAKFAPPGWRLRKAHWPRFRQAGTLIQSGGKTAVAKHEPITLPVVSAGALSLGITKAPEVGRVSPGQAGLSEVQGGPAKAPVTFPKLKFDPAGSFLNRDISPNRNVLLVPSVMAEIRTDSSGANMPSPPP